MAAIALVVTYAIVGRTDRQPPAVPDEPTLLLAAQPDAAELEEHPEPEGDYREFDDEEEDAMSEAECFSDDALHELARAGIPTRLYLYVSGPCVTDAGLRALATATQLDTLHLYLGSDCGISADGLAVLARLPALRTLHLQGELDDAMLMMLADAPALEELRVNSSWVRGKFLEVAPRLPRLRRLDLWCKWFTGVGVRFLDGLNIEAWYHSDGLTDAGCREIIAHWPGSSLRLKFNPLLTGAALQNLGNAQHLTHIELHGWPLAPDAQRGLLSLQNLADLDLRGSTGLDAGFLAGLAQSPALRKLSLELTDGCEAGMIALLEHPQLETLSVACAGATDAVFAAAVRNPNLKCLEVPVPKDEREEEAFWALSEARSGLSVRVPNGKWSYHYEGFRAEERRIMQQARLRDR